jgi:hypothetical protein
MFILDHMPLPCIHIGRRTRLGPITWFPLWTDNPAGPPLATGPGASITVEEMDGQPQVEKLVVANPGDVAVLLVEGELLEGGWQHRVLQHDYVLAAGRRQVVDVNCVEQARWHGGTTQVRRSRRAAPRVRTAMTTARPDARQGAVWGQVAEYQEAFGASPTGSFVDHIDAYERDARQQPDLLTGISQVRPLSGQRGIAYGTAGYPIGLELFSTEEALAEHLEQILASVLLDATAVASSAGVDDDVPGRRMRRLVAVLDALDPPPDPDVEGGAGLVRAADTDKLIVRGITVGDTWAHLSVFDRRHPLVHA